MYDELQEIKAVFKQWCEGKGAELDQQEIAWLIEKAEESVRLGTVGDRVGWGKEGVNYWENPDCPREYLEEALRELVAFVEGVKLPIDHFEGDSREELVARVEFYEYLAEK